METAPWLTETDGTEGVYAVTDDREVWSVFFHEGMTKLTRDGLRYQLIGKLPDVPPPAINEARWHRPSLDRPLRPGLWWIRQYVGSIPEPHSFVINMSPGVFPSFGTEYAYIGPTPPKPLEQE